MANLNDSFNLQPVRERLMEEAYRLLAALPLLLLAVLVIWVAWRIGGWVSKRTLLERVAPGNPFLRDLVRSTTRWLVLLIGVVVALEILDATALVGAVLGTAGVLGVALGFAFKDILENYLAGLLLSLRQPFAPRDHVVIDGNEGVVVSLTSRATILMTLDGNHLRLPNALVFRGVMLNYTRNPNRRFEFEVGVGVEEDLVQAQRIGLNELAECSSVLATPPPRAFITALGDSNVQVRFQGWLDQRESDYHLARSEAIRRVKLALEAAGMDMPEPIYRLQIASAPSLVKEIASSPAISTAPREPLKSADVSDLDTRAHKDIDGQIDRDKLERSDEDLLDTNAARE